MNLRDTIYDAVWEEYGSSNQVLWEEIIRGTAGLQRVNSVAVGSDEDKRKALLRAAELAQREIIGEYLSEAFPDFQKGHGLAIGDYAYTTYGGVLEDKLIDVMSVSTTDYRTAHIDPHIVIPAAAKAHILGLERLELIAFDRSKQDWFCYTVRGDFRRSWEFMEAAATRGPLPRPGELTVESNMLLLKQLNTYLESLNRRPAGEGKGQKKARATGVIHPSELSTKDCDRLIAYGLVEEVQQERVWAKLRKVFDIGHIYHDIIQHALVWSMPDFEPEVPIRNVQLQILGHCDGKYADEGIEIKTFGAVGFSKISGPKPEHVEQATIYAVHLDLNIMNYVYVCKETAEIQVFRANVDRKVWHQLATRATRIIQSVNRGQLPPPITGKDSTCKSCKYCWTCKPELIPTSKERMFSR